MDDVSKATEAEKQLRDMIINNYDDFAHDYISNTRNVAVQQTQRYGVTGVEQHLQDKDLRPKFFEQSEKDLGGYKWSDHAKKTTVDYAHVANML